ncbi:hypothetical protein [Streptomyces sp. NPDC048191]|uniref:hypothetical protein n=1 Tax=Streptomyces sp. NPDC048191 TaxID=3155484 RepID=UPI0033D2ECBB
MHKRSVADSRRVLVGGLLWLSLIQVFFVNNLIVLPHASSQNLVEYLISALGMTQCDRIHGMRFCSPWHEAADIAWIFGGLSLSSGAVLNMVFFPSSRLRNRAFGALTISGLGLVSAGFNPYNVRTVVHLLSAGTCFISGAVGVVLLGGMLLQRSRPYLGMIGIACGVTSLIGTALAALRVDLEVQGAFERASAWPSLLWLIGTGGFLASTAWRTSRSGSR